MIDIIKYIGGIFVDIYNILDVNIFPDIPYSFIDIVIGICLFVVLLKFFFGFFRSSDFSIGNTIRGMLDDTREKRQNLFYFKGYVPKHSKEGYTPKHGTRR